MKKYIFLIPIFLISLTPTHIYAGEANELGVCFTDSLTGKERKMLAKWVFFAMSAHPELSPYLKVSDQTKDEVNKFVGNLLTRLLVENCPRQTKAALKEDGNMAMQAAFEWVGKVAMKELMTNRDVAASMSGFEKYLDIGRIKKSLNKQ